MTAPSQEQKCHLLTWADNLVLTEVPFKARGRDPLEGLDCYGLVWLAFKDVLGLDIPSYSDQYKESEVHHPGRVSDLLLEHRAGWSETDHARPFDIAGFKLKGVPLHVGLVTAPGQMVHIMDGINVSQVRYNRREWGTNLLGFWRNEQLR